MEPPQHTEPSCPHAVALQKHKLSRTGSGPHGSRREVELFGHCRGPKGTLKWLQKPPFSCYWDRKPCAQFDVPRMGQSWLGTLGVLAHLEGTLLGTESLQPRSAKLPTCQFIIYLQYSVERDISGCRSEDMSQVGPPHKAHQGPPPELGLLPKGVSSERLGGEPSCS